MIGTNNDVILYLDAIAEQACTSPDVDDVHRKPRHTWKRKNINLRRKAVPAPGTLNDEDFIELVSNAWHKNSFDTLVLSLLSRHCYFSCRNCMKSTGVYFECELTLPSFFIATSSIC